MCYRAFAFLFSLSMIVGAVAGDCWLITTGQVATVDGLFLFCSSLVIAFAFGLYLRFFIRSALPQAQVRPAITTSPAQADRRTTANAETTAVLPNVQ
jgi:hypothetical protein